MCPDLECRSEVHRVVSPEGFFFSEIRSDSNQFHRDLHDGNLLEEVNQPSLHRAMLPNGQAPPSFGSSQGGTGFDDNQGG